MGSSCSCTNAVGTERSIDITVSEPSVLMSYGVRREQDPLTGTQKLRAESNLQREPLPRVISYDAIECTQFMKQNSNEVEAIIETEYGLLDSLLSDGVITHRQLTLIQRKRTEMMDARQFIEEITAEPLSSENFLKLLKALDSTNQKHVSNYLLGRGVYRGEFQCDWPLCFQYRSKITLLDKRRFELIGLIDSRNGLLNKMMAEDGISLAQKEAVSALQTDLKRNGLLLDILRRGSRATYEKFIQCLDKTKQRSVLAILEPDCFPDFRLLSEENKLLLKTQYSRTIGALDTVNGLTAKMYGDSLITKQQKEFIESPITQTEKNERLMDVVNRFDELYFNGFIACLNDTGQRHIASRLSGSGSNFYLSAENIPSLSQTSDYEKSRHDGICRFVEISRSSTTSLPATGRFFSAPPTYSPRQPLEKPC
jgi:Caspase recruitment domain